MAIAADGSTWFPRAIDPIILPYVGEHCPLWALDFYEDVVKLWGDPDPMRCAHMHNPGVWPYVSRCTLRPGHRGTLHVDMKGRTWRDGEGWILDA